MKFLFTPDWFLSIDVIIEFVSFLVLLTFFLLAYKNYKLGKNKNFLFLGIGFFIIALAEIATILTKGVLYYDTTFTRQIGRMVVSYHLVQSVDIFYYIGFFFHKLLTLLGLYVIYRQPLKEKYTGDVLIAIGFFIIAAIFSNSFYYIFHLTALILLVLIINNYSYIYRENRSENTKMLMLAFGLLTFSHIIMIVSNAGLLYAFAQIIQLASYITLLALIIKILNYGKKEKQDQHNIRYVGNYTRKGRKN